jgi:hypothetical protein
LREFWVACRSQNNPRRTVPDRVPPRAVNLGFRRPSCPRRLDRPLPRRLDRPVLGSSASGFPTTAWSSAFMRSTEKSVNCTWCYFYRTFLWAFLVAVAMFSVEPKTDTKLFDYMTQRWITIIFSYFPLIGTWCLTMLHFRSYINFSSDAIFSDTIKALRVSYKKIDSFCVPLILQLQAWVLQSVMEIYAISLLFLHNDISYAFLAHLAMFMYCIVAGWNFVSYPCSQEVHYIFTFSIIKPYLWLEP